MMKSKLTISVLLGLLVTKMIGYGQDPPNDPKFVRIGILYGEANQGAPAFHGTQAVLFPKNFKLDRSYHQTQTALSGGGAQTTMKVTDIPPGIHLKVTGGHYWAVFNPVLASVDEDDEGRPIQRKFLLDLYCGPAGWPGPGCNVRAEVWAKSK